MPTLVLAPIHNHLTRSQYDLALGSVALPLTGTTVETALARVSLTPAQMGPNGVLAITMAWSYIVTATNKTPRLRFGPAGITPPSGVLIFGGAPRTAPRFEQAVILVRNRNNQAIQVSSSAMMGTGSGTYFTLDTSAACDLIFTGELANAADTMSLEGYEVELFYGA